MSTTVQMRPFCLVTTARGTSKSESRVLFQGIKPKSWRRHMWLQHTCSFQLPRNCPLPTLLQSYFAFNNNSRVPISSQTTCFNQPSHALRSPAFLFICVPNYSPHYHTSVFITISKGTGIRISVLISWLLLSGCNYYYYCCLFFVSLVCVYISTGNNLQMVC